MTKMIRAIIFDFDGTIVDTETPWYDAFREVFKEEGAELPMDVWGLVVGSVDDPLYAHLEKVTGRPVDIPSIRKRAGGHHVARMEEHAELRPGVEDYLKTAQALGLRIGLASSSKRDWVVRFLKQFDLLHYFETIRTAEDVAKVKPDPELYMRALEDLGVAGSEAMALEDSPNGTRAAVEAGINCVIVPNDTTRGLTFDRYAIRLDSLTDMKLEEVLNHINNKQE
jgi:putative hydrolase of the HAD superfamily